VSFFTYLLVILRKNGPFWVKIALWDPNMGPNHAPVAKLCVWYALQCTL
jgi:hypothetical protein